MTIRALNLEWYRTGIVSVMDEIYFLGNSKRNYGALKECN